MCSITSRLEEKCINGAKISYMPLCMSFHPADFHETLTCSVVLSRYIPYHIPPKTVTKYGKYGYKVIYVLKWSTNVTEWVFKKLCLALLDNFLKRTPCNEFHWNPKNYSVADTRSLRSDRHGLCIMHFFHFIKNAWKCNYCNTVTHKAAVPYHWHVRLAEQNTTNLPLLWEQLMWSLHEQMRALSLLHMQHNWPIQLLLREKASKWEKHRYSEMCLW
jgi:hypothetical protein